MEDKLEKLYRDNGFEVLELTSMEMQDGLDWFSSTTNVFEDMFPPHERNPGRDELTDAIKNPSQYKILVLGRQTDQGKQVAALTVLFADEEKGVVNLEYLSRDPKIKIAAGDKEYKVSGGFILRKGLEYAVDHTTCGTMLMECELPSAAGRDGKITMDPVERILWYNKQGYELVPVDDSKVTSAGLPIWCYMAKSLRGDKHPGYDEIADFIENDSLERRNPETHARTLDNLRWLSKNPDDIPESLSLEMRGLVAKVKEESKLPEDVLVGGAVMTTSCGQIKQPSASRAG